MSIAKFELYLMVIVYGFNMYTNKLSYSVCLNEYVIVCRYF